MIHIYLVGGAVRNFLLKLPIKDRDWVVLNSSIYEMKKLGYIKVGKNFPVFLHPLTHEEYALARIEKKISLGYKGFNFIINNKVSLKDDLYRRDLTINAIAINPKTKKIYDPFNGCKDIKYKLIKHVSNAFIEDPLRILRVARFAAELYYLNFSIATNTLKLITKMSIKKELISISPERIWEETEKALSVNNPEIFFKILYKCNALSIIFPEINKLFSFKNKKYPNSLAFHSLKCLKIISKFTNDIDIRFATLLHDIEKINNKYIKNNNLSIKKSLININILCERLHIPNNIKKLITLTLITKKEINTFNKLSPLNCLKLLNKVDFWRNPNILDKLICIYEVNYLSYFIQKKINYYPIFIPKIFIKQIIKIFNKIDIDFYINKLNNNSIFKGKFIKQIINKLRLKYLTKWKKNII